VGANPPVSTLFRVAVATALTVIQMLSASKATAARLVISTTSAIASYSSQCQLFKSMTAFRRRACSYADLATPTECKLPEK
jgi:hypothetical protein